MAENSWHLDKKVPIAIIFAILMQTVGIVWWASQMDSRVAHLEGDGSLFVTKIECMKNHEVIDERMRSTERLTERIEGSINRMDNKLDRLIEKSNGDD